MTKKSRILYLLVNVATALRFWGALGDALRSEGRQSYLTELTFRSVLTHVKR